MPLSEGYGVLKCQAIGSKMEREDLKSPHYTIIAADTKTEDREYRVVINVKSIKKPFDLLVLLNDNYKHPLTDELVKLDFGFTEIKPSERKAGGVALDFIRSNLFDATQMKPVPADLPGRENDVNDLIDFFIQEAIGNSNVDIYAFGEPFKTGFGIHNIHMNQGDTTGSFSKEDGVFQDGALFIHSRDRSQWLAFFSAFQSQSFHTDDRTGKAIDKDDRGEQIDTGVGAEPIPVTTASIKIVAALVNPIGADPSQETITLLNTSAQTIDLQGWSLADRLKRKMSLTGQVEAGDSRRIQLSGADIQLSNDGGIITLLNPQDLKVDGVSYTKNDVSQQGQTFVF